jgi:hypothetical protein
MPNDSPGHLTRVRSAEVAVEMMNGRPLRVVWSVFSMLTFKSDGTLVLPLQDRHVRARTELALALGHRPATQGLPKPVLGLSPEAVNGRPRRLSRDGSSKPPWGARNVPEYHPPDAESNDRSSRSLGDPRTPSLALQRDIARRCRSLKLWKLRSVGATVDWKHAVPLGTKVQLRPHTVTA